MYKRLTPTERAERAHQARMQEITEALVQIEGVVQELNQAFKKLSKATNELKVKVDARTGEQGKILD